MDEKDFDLRGACKRYTNPFIEKLSALPINYVGNKKKLLESISTFLHDEEVSFDSVFDAFSGSSVVSILFASMGKDVTCNDLLSLSSLTAKFYLQMRGVPLEGGDTVALADCKFGSPDPPVVIGGRYTKTKEHSDRPDLFTTEEAYYIDCFRDSVLGTGSFTTGLGVDGQPNIIGGTGGYHDKAAYAMYAFCNHILQICFRGGRYYNGQTLARQDAREGLICSASVNSGLSMNKERAQHVLTSMQKMKGKCTVYNCDLIKLLEARRISTDLIYLDPPYGGESSDYTGLYRVCEEIIRGHSLDDDPQLVEASNRFKGKKGYKGAFDDVLDLCGDFPIWLISFNESSYASIDEIVQQIRRFRKDVIPHKVKYRYNYRKKSSQKENEFLILAR